MRRGDVLEILDGRKSPLSHDSGFDSGLGSQSLSANRSEGEATIPTKGRCRTQTIDPSVRLCVCVCVCVSLSVSQSVRQVDR